MKGFWLVIAVGCFAGCNSFSALEPVVESGTDSGAQDSGVVDLGATDVGATDLGATDLDLADLGPDLPDLGSDMMPPKTYTGIDPGWFYQRDGTCTGALEKTSILISDASNFFTDLPATNISIAMNAGGAGFVRWTEDNTIRGAAVSMDSATGSYVPGVAPWSDFSQRFVYDTVIVRAGVSNTRPPGDFFVATLSKCGAALDGKHRYGEFGPAIGDVTFFTNEGDVCPGPTAENFAVGIGGGFNPFDPDYEFANLYIASFGVGKLNSWNTGTGLSQNATVDLDAGVGPDLATPFVESTTGALIGFASDDEKTFSFWNTVAGGPIFDSGFPGVRGKIALLHLVSEHYVLAVVNTDNTKISLYRFEYQIEDVPEEAQILWLNEEPEVISVTGDPILYMELAAMPGGFAVFYAQKSQWIIQPVLVVKGQSVERLIVDAGAQVFSAGDAKSTYIDMDFTTTVLECDLVFSLMSSYIAGIMPLNFTIFEGASITNFYASDP